MYCNWIHFTPWQVLFDITVNCKRKSTSRKKKISYGNMKKKMNCVHSNLDLIDDLYSLVLPSKPVTLRCLATFCFLWLPLPHSRVMQCFHNKGTKAQLSVGDCDQGSFCLQHWDVGGAEELVPWSLESSQGPELCKPS